MGFNLTSDPLELLLGILCLVGVIYICPSIIAVYFYLAKRPSTDLGNIEEGEMKFEMEEEMKAEGIKKVKGIEQAENSEQVEQLESFLNFEGVESFGDVQNSEGFKKFDEDGEMIKGRRLWEETYAPLPIRAKDDEWEIV